MDYFNALQDCSQIYVIEGSSQIKSSQALYLCLAGTVKLRTGKVHAHGRSRNMNL